MEKTDIPNQAGIRRIDPGDWIPTGAGAVGQSFVNRNDPSLILKMNNGEASLDLWAREIANARAIYDIGLPTPRPGYIAFDGQRYGLVFEYIQGKKSYARAVGDASSMDEIDRLGRSFADVCLKLHSTNCKVPGLLDVKDYTRNAIISNPFHSQDIKDKALNVLESLPDGEVGIHGDLHFGNVITAAGKDYLIDLGTFSYGYYKFDLGMMVFVAAGNDFVSEEKFMELYHCGFERTRRFHQAAADRYFGHKVVLEDLVDEFMPYAAMRLFSMENQMNSEALLPMAERALRYLTEH
ncbi:MAG: phosphotransferase [Bacteroidales bacterium]|nr:phosphotransferase [Bacteroidales bacterium]